MVNVKDIRFQWYDGNIHHPFPKGYISVEEFVNKHKNPSKEIVTVFNLIEDASENGDLKYKNWLKQNKLYYFTPAALFSGRRKYENIVGFTGLAQLDFDKVERAYDLREYLFENYKQIVCAYVSPSGRGVKALVKITTSKNIDEFKEYYAGLTDEFEGIDGFDTAPKNVALPLFLSYDTHILYRPDAETWTEKGKIMQVGDYVNLIPTNQPNISYNDTGYKSLDYYKKISIDIFDKKIDSIVDSDGHPRMRDACLVLGSRAGAGYLTISEAESHAVWKVSSNKYFHKDLANYIRTVHWALNQGARAPKYYS